MSASGSCLVPVDVTHAADTASEILHGRQPPVIIGRSWCSTCISFTLSTFGVPKDAFELHAITSANMSAAWGGQDLRNCARTVDRVHHDRSVESSKTIPYHHLADCRRSDRAQQRNSQLPSPP